MKTIKIISLALLCAFFSNSYSQRVNVTFKLFTDINGDCFKQSNEPYFTRPFIFYEIYQNTSLYAVDRFFYTQDTAILSLDTNKIYSIHTRLDTPILSVNCSVGKSYYFSIGKSDTTILIPYKDTIPALLFYQNPWRNNVTSCLGDTFILNEIEMFKSAGNMNLTYEWGDGKIDTIDVSNIGTLEDQKHFYPSLGKYFMRMRAFDKNWNLRFTDIDTISVVNCRDITCKVFLDTNGNCIHDGDLILRQSVSLLDTFSNFIRAYNADSNGIVMIKSIPEGRYRLACKDIMLNCAAGTIPWGDDFVNINLIGTNLTKEIPVKDTIIYPISQSNLYIQDKFNLCINREVTVGYTNFNPTLFHAVFDWGDSKRDTFLNFDPRFSNDFKHIYNSLGSKYLKLKFYKLNWTFLDSVIDTINVIKCSYVSGKMFVDNNANCIYNTGIDTLVRHYLIIIKDSNNVIKKYVYSNQNGEYEFFYDSSKSFKVYAQDYFSCNAGLKYFTVGPWNSNSLVKDISFSKDTIDYILYAGSRGRFFPGDSARLYFTYRSISNISTSSQYKFNLPSKASLKRVNNSSSHSVNGNIVTVNYNTNDVNQNYVVLKFDTTLTLKDTFCFNVSLRKIGNEPDTLNNQFTFCVPALVSYDPNDKKVAINSILNNGNFTNKNDYFFYTIRFQNTGNAPAQNIYVKDVLDSKLDLETLKVIYSSHSMESSLDDNREISFNFRNINLIDSMTDEKNSHGLIYFMIKPKDNLQLEEAIENHARIYFDFNEPILTNNVVSKYVKLSNSGGGGSSIVSQSKNDVTFYPIPAINVLNFSDDKKKEYRIMDASGKVILEGTCQGQLNIASLDKGVFILQISSNDYHSNFKFLKE
jgi:uncharacterized repeat protein (TIGR01451 family)